MRNLNIVSINGAIMHTKDARISPFDRSLRLGDGLFETIRVHKGKVLHMASHLSRLHASAVELDIRIPELHDLIRMVHDFMSRSTLREGALRITLTRGDSDGVWPHTESPSVLLMTAAEGIPYPQETIAQGLAAVVVDEPRRLAGVLSRHKTTSFLASVIARKVAVQVSAAIAIMRNQYGRIAEADAANIFVALPDARIVTPPIEEGALPGIIRARLIAAVSGIEERPLTEEEIYDAREIIFTNALMPAIPASSIDGKPLTDRAFLNEALAALEKEE